MPMTVLQKLAEKVKVLDDNSVHKDVLHVIQDMAAILSSHRILLDTVDSRVAIIEKRLLTPHERSVR